MSSVLRSEHVSAPSFRIWSPDTPTQEPPPNSAAAWTVRRIFSERFIPLYIKAKGLAEATETCYRESVDWWDELTDGPTFDLIDDFVTSAFVEVLVQKPGRACETMSLYTVRKHCTNLQKLFDFIGPKTRNRHGRRNQEILERVPYIERPDGLMVEPEGDFTLEEVLAMQAQAHRMLSPSPDFIFGLVPGAWWRALLTVAPSTGLRVGNLMRLRYEDLHGNWIRVRPRDSKRGKGKRQFLTPEALAEIEAIRTPRKYIFQPTNWVTNPRRLQYSLKLLEKYAGLPKERQFGFHGFRKLHATMLAGNNSENQGIKTAQLALGHESTTVTKGFYINATVQEKLVAEELKKLPSFRRKAHSEDPNQMHLF